MGINAHIADPSSKRRARVSANGGIAVAPVGSRVISGRFTAASLFVTGSVAAQNVMSIENPASSEQLVYINKATLKGTTSAQSAILFMYHLGRTTAMPTGGTLASIQKSRSTIEPGQAIVRVAPSATAASGDKWTDSYGPFSTGIIPLPLSDCINSRGEDDDEILEPGEALLFWIDANAITFKHWANIRWQEGTDGI